MQIIVSYLTSLIGPHKLGKVKWQVNYTILGAYMIEISGIRMSEFNDETHHYCQFHVLGGKTLLASKEQLIAF